MCPHDCDIDSNDHKPGCAWRHDFTAGSRMQAVPRREQETK